jgi:hypothetical protein
MVLVQNWLLSTVLLATREGGAGGGAVQGVAADEGGARADVMVQEEAVLDLLHP